MTICWKSIERLWPATAKEIIELLDSHFAKEEQILFPLARQVLDPPTKGSVDAAMEDMR